ncbi:hypothetical protein MKY96_33825 [Paenibacillus sp. FSL R7-0302]
MKTILTIATGIGILIAVYLFLGNFSATVSIINAVGKNSTAGIKTLQGRD